MPAADDMTGTLTIQLHYLRPIVQESGDLLIGYGKSPESRFLEVASIKCTEAQAAAIVAKYKELNPEQTEKFVCVWVGPRKIS